MVFKVILLSSGKGVVEGREGVLKRWDRIRYFRIVVFSGRSRVMRDIYLWYEERFLGVFDVLDKLIKRFKVMIF